MVRLIIKISPMKNIYKLLLILFITSTAKAQTYIPTWSDDIACIFYSRCTSCHNANGIAPFSLIDYNDAVAYATGIQTAVNSKYMPPWPPDVSYQTLAHERILTPQEITLINDWINNGTQQGNIANAPAPPVYSSAAQITAPDISLVMPNYVVPPLSSDMYRCFVMPTNVSVDKYLAAIEILPGNRNIVHHVLVYQDVANTALTLGSLDPDPGYTSFGGPGSNSAELVGGWVPGSEPYFLPAGMGIKLKANSKIILQIHYPLGSTGQTDSTRVNFLYSTSPSVRNVRVDPLLYHNAPVLQNGPLFIPANTIQTFHEMFTIPAIVGNVTLLTVGPHMHLIGTQAESYAVSTLLDTIPLIRINNWDFHWQGFYSFRKPVKIPAGSTLHAYATYDNTGGNPNNPNNPPQNVGLGENTTDEMMLTYFYWLPYVTGDENIAVDTVTVPLTYNGCTYTTGINDHVVNSNFRVYPNPATDFAVIDLPGEHYYQVAIQNAMGQEVKIYNNIKSSLKIDCSKLNKGIYFLKVSSEKNSFYQKLEVI